MVNEYIDKEVLVRLLKTALEGIIESLGSFLLNQDHCLMPPHILTLSEERCLLLQLLLDVRTAFAPS